MAVGIEIVENKLGERKTRRVHNPAQTFPPISLFHIHFHLPDLPILPIVFILSIHSGCFIFVVFPSFFVFLVFVVFSNFFAFPVIAAFSNFFIFPVVVVSSNLFVFLIFIVFLIVPVPILTHIPAHLLERLQLQFSHVCATTCCPK
ncbi:hypothetical protein BD779DRAFT_1574476 [Infundibulicybe gibba]|nr:hypothetical protein BD779DRAFT_1574476 [Infundibulicybe gibba]